MNFQGAFRSTGPTADEAVARNASIKAALDALSIREFSEDTDPILEDAWLIGGVIPDAGLGAVFGAPGSGKSFFCLDMALTIGGAKPTWRGNYVEQGPVLYLGMEGGRLFQNRISAYYTYHRASAPHFFRCPVTVNLRSSEEAFTRLKAAAEAIAERSGQGLKMIVVDTLNRAMAGGNENSPEDMGAFVASCDALAKELNCYVLIVHHSGKDAARGMRGHSSLIGAVDTEIEISNDTATVSKQRDGPDGEQFGFTLVTVELGGTPRGKTVTSCVVEPAEPTESKPSLGKNQKKALEALTQYVDDHGRSCPSGTGWPEPGTRKCVRRDDFIPFLADKMTNNDQKDRTKTAKRALDDLIEKGITQINQGRLWLVRTGGDKRDKLGTNTRLSPDADGAENWR